MRTSLRVACITFSAAAIATAGTCSSGPLSAYIALGVGGCTVGNTLFNDFASLPIPATASQINPSAVMVTTTATPLHPTLTFAIGSSANSGTGMLDINIGFNAVDEIGGSQVMLIAPSFTGDGSVTGIHDACPNGAFDSSGTCSTTDFNAVVTDTSGLTDLSEGTSFPPAGHVAFMTDIGIDPGTAGTASLRSAAVTVDVVPEPERISLVAGALVLLLCGLRSRRLRLRRVFDMEASGGEKCC